MSRFLMAWELGEGMGHLNALMPVGNELFGRGHTVIAALKKLPKPTPLTDNNRQLPILLGPPDVSPSYRDFSTTSTYCQLLHHAGFGDAEFLAWKVQAWLDLITVSSPDFLICDHSPFAILAARVCQCPVILLGTGFTCPTTDPDLPSMIPELVPSPDVHEKQNNHLVENCNQILRKHHSQPLHRLADLYRETAASYLLTFAELDHFGPRADTTYWGCWSFGKRQEVTFPTGTGPKIFGYLKSWNGLELLLQKLSQLRNPTLLVNFNFSPQQIQKYSTEHLMLSTQPVNIDLAAKWCDFAILNAGQASVASILRAGKPILNIPLHLEQVLMSKLVVKLQAGGAANCNDPQTGVFGLRMLRDYYPELGRNAQSFANKYQQYDSQAALQQVVDQIEWLVK